MSSTRSSEAPSRKGSTRITRTARQLLELVRFKSHRRPRATRASPDYKSRMKPDQKAIYYITGDNETNLRESPLLEMYRKKEIEVLIMDDEIDEFVIPAVGKLQGHRAQVGQPQRRRRGPEDRERQGEGEGDRAADQARSRRSLKDRVKDVKASTRLSDSPSCIVADQTDPTVQMQALLKTLGKEEFQEVKPILEINPTHPIIVRMLKISDDGQFADVSALLLEQAMLLEGMKLENPSAFVKRLNGVLEKSI